MAAPCRQMFVGWKSIIVKKASLFGGGDGVHVERDCRLHQKVALAVVELWMSVTHAGDVVGILLGAWLWKIFVFKLASLF